MATNLLAVAHTQPAPAEFDAIKYATTIVFAAALALFAPLSAAVDYAGTNVGAIPDGSPGGRDLVFAVAGASLPLGDLRLSMTLAHSSVGDLEAVLTSPAGIAHLIVFGRTGYRRGQVTGAAANLAGTYSFNDDASNDWWATVAGSTTTFNMPAGNYRTSTQGYFGAVLSEAGGCATYLRGAFRGLAAAQTNGIWTLRLADLNSGETGSISAATLSIDGQDGVFASGFEGPLPPLGSSVRGFCRAAPFDFTGTGLSSYALTRNTGGGAGGAISWFIRSNDGSAGGTPQNFVFGNAGDYFLAGDFDGDGIRDATLWHAAGGGSWIVRRSSRPDDAPLTLLLGETGDDPTHIGDYDGDGISDPAVYRAGVTVGAASHTLIRLSSTNAIRDLTTGVRGNTAAAGIDYSGDGVADVAMLSDAGANAGHLTIYSGLDGGTVGAFDFGLANDVLVVGNHAGPMLGDITVVRANGGAIDWTTRDTATGIATTPIVLGASATDYPLGGDYDGDGSDDYAVWHADADPALSRFSIRRSTSPATAFDVFMGQQTDYPVANAQSH